MKECEKFLGFFNNANEEMLQFLQERLNKEDFKQFQNLLGSRDMFKHLYKTHNN